MAKFSPVKTLIGKMTPIDSSEHLIGKMDGNLRERTLRPVSALLMMMKRHLITLCSLL